MLRQVRFHRRHIGASKTHVVIGAMHMQLGRLWRFIFSQMHHIVIADVEPIPVSRARYALADSEPQNIAIKIAQLEHGIAVSAKIYMVDFGERHIKRLDLVYAREYAIHATASHPPHLAH